MTLDRFLYRTLGALATAHVLLLSLACGTSGEGTPEQDVRGDDETIRIDAVEFGRALGANGQVADAVDVFVPTDSPIHLTLHVAGRPTGIITFTTDYYGNVITTSVDLSTINDDVIWSAGQTTYVTNTLTSDSGSFYQGEYETVVTHGEHELGRYPFRVGPPPGATPAVVHLVQMTADSTQIGCPIEPARTSFGVGETMQFAARLDVGRTTWVEVRWTRDGQPLEDMTRSLNFSEDVTGNCFSLQYRWLLPGPYEATLQMNGETIGTYPLTVVPSPRAG